MALDDLVRDLRNVSGRVLGFAGRQAYTHLWQNQNIRYTLMAASVGAAAYFGMAHYATETFGQGSNAAAVMTTAAGIPLAAGLATMLQRRIPNPSMRDLVGIGKWAITAYAAANQLVNSEVFTHLQYTRFAMDNIHDFGALQQGVQYLSALVGGVLGAIYGTTRVQQPAQHGAHGPTVTWDNRTGTSTHH